MNKAQKVILIVGAACLLLLATILPWHSYSLSAYGPWLNERKEGYHLIGFHPKGTTIDSRRAATPMAVVVIATGAAYFVARALK